MEHLDVSSMASPRFIMITYWILFFAISGLALIANNRNFATSDSLVLYKLNYLWLFIIFILSIFIGFRYQVGGDWIQYVEIYDAIGSAEFDGQISVMMDPGYLYLNLLMSKLNTGIYGVNLVTGIIFSTGLAIFCRQFPRPLLALAVAIPYLTIVVAMGYSRQSAALGFAMIAFAALRNDNTVRFIIFIIIAATFHKTAIVLIPLVLASQSTNRLAVIIWGFATVPILYFLFLSDSIAFLLEHYVMNIDERFQSQGALIRVGMNVVSAIIFLMFASRFSVSQSDRNWLKLFSWITLICLFGLLVSDSSAAIDRLALYLLPLQLVVFSYLPDAFTNDKELKKLIILFIVSYYGLVLFVWLNFGVHSQEWLPYKNILIN